MEAGTNRPMWVTAMLALPGEEYRLWCYLYWRQGNNSDAWPSQSAIAKDLGLTVQGVRNITRRLQDKGWLQIESPESRGRSHGLRYTVVEGIAATAHSTAEKVNSGLPFETEKGFTPVYPLKPEKVNGRLPKGSTKKCSHIRRTLYKNTNNNTREDNLLKTHNENLFGTPIHTGSGGVTPFANGEHFDRFWVEYPRKVARKKCLGIWRSLKLTTEQAERVIGAVRCYTRTDQWQKDDGRFIPHPSTFLNQRRWEDEIPTRPEPKRGDPDWDPTDEEGIAIFRECGVEVKPGPASAEDVERLRRQLGVKCKVVAG